MARHMQQNKANLVIKHLSLSKYYDAIVFYKAKLNVKIQNQRDEDIV